jgi:hypothetical protein
VSVYVYKDEEQWIPFFKWFWYALDEGGKPIIKEGTDGMGHGAYPAKWVAWLSAFIHIKILRKS